MNDPKAIEELRVIYETINFNEVETNCLSALGQICDATLLDNIYKYAIVEDNVRNQDLMVQLLYQTFIQTNYTKCIKFSTSSSVVQLLNSEKHLFGSTLNNTSPR